MLTLYTSIGLLKIEKDSDKPYPTVINSGYVHALDPCELVIWSALAFQFLSFRDIKQQFEENLERRNQHSSYSFEHYLRRLIFRKLIIKGDGLTSIDALYDLLGGLHIVPLADAFPVRLFSALHLVLKKQLPLQAVKYYLKAQTTEAPVEKLILRLVKERALSTAELLHCFDKGNISPENASPDLMAVTADDEMTCEELQAYTHVHYLQTPVLMAIGNLYLQKRIQFRTL